MIEFRNYISRFSSLLILVFLCSKTFGQLTSVTATVDKKQILIGEQILYRVDVSMPDNTYRLSWFNVPDSFGAFHVVSSGKIDSGFTSGRQSFRQELTLTSFDSGRQFIPSLEFHADPLTNDSSYTIFTDSIPIDVSFSPMDSVKTFHDIKTIIEVKDKLPWWVWALIGLGVVILLLLIIFWKKLFGKKEKPQQIIEARLSPYDEAIKDLKKLEAAHLPEHGQTKEFHVRLADIFRRYFTRKTNLNKMHLTSDELLMDLQEYGVDKTTVSAFANCLRMNNAVKFAKFIPANDQSNSCLVDTKNIISHVNNLPNPETPGAA